MGDGIFMVAFDMGDGIFLTESFHQIRKTSIFYCETIVFCQCTV